MKDKSEARENEACSLVFGDTLEKSFPLILIIGREANNHSCVVSKIGHYKFPTRANFWSYSHGLVARYTDLPTGKFKSNCKKQNASPIVFSDASPWGLDDRYKRNEKRTYRKAIPGAELKAHANNVFSQNDIVSRVALVLISGVEECGLTHAMPFIQAQCDTHQLPYVHIATLSGTTKKHSHDIRMAQIGAAGDAIIRSCTNQFLFGPQQKAA